MQKLLTCFNHYYHYHTKKATLWTHFIGVPLVTLSLMIVLAWLKIVIPGMFQTNLAWLIVLGLMIYYFSLDTGLGCATSILLIVLCTIASLLSRLGPSILSFGVFLITFTLGWIFQIAGHMIEGKKPALLDHLSLALIAPMFIVAEVLFMLGYRHDLQRKMHNTQHEHPHSTSK